MGLKALYTSTSLCTGKNGSYYVQYVLTLFLVSLRVLLFFCFFALVCLLPRARVETRHCGVRRAPVRTLLKDAPRGGVVAAVPR